MEEAHIVIIKDGKGSTQLPNGDHEVSSQTLGYDNTTIIPKSITVDDSHDSYSFKVGGQGRFYINVTEDGTVTSKVIVGATFVRCDKTGTAYGTPIVTDTKGSVVFNHVPFVSGGGGPVIYYRQTASDGAHNFDDALKTITLTSNVASIYIANPKPILKTINLGDGSYEGLSIENGQITLS